MCSSVFAALCAASVAVRSLFSLASLVSAQSSSSSTGGSDGASSSSGDDGAASTLQVSAVLIAALAFVANKVANL